MLETERAMEHQKCCYLIKSASRDSLLGTTDPEESLRFGSPTNQVFEERLLLRDRCLLPLSQSPRFHLHALFPIADYDGTFSKGGSVCR